jgi:uncharacterized protein (DUF2237 family)
MRFLPAILVLCLACGARDAMVARSPVGEAADASKQAECEVPERSASCAYPDDVPVQEGNLNVLGTPLEVCSTAPLTGFRRSGRCETGPEDRGVHVVCAAVTDAFLEYSRARGNDLITPAPRYRFPGLQDGDRWCLCASRWAEAAEAGVAPPVVLEATDDAALRHIDAALLERHRRR